MVVIKLDLILCEYCGTIATIRERETDSEEEKEKKKKTPNRILYICGQVLITIV